MFGLGRHWVKAEGVVVAEHLVSCDIWMNPTYEYVIEVRPQSGQPFRAKVRQPKDDFWSPGAHPGETVGLEMDPKTMDVRFDASDPRTSFKAQRSARQHDFDQELNR